MIKDEDYYYTRSYLSSLQKQSKPWTLKELQIFLKGTSSSSVYQSNQSKDFDKIRHRLKNQGFHRTQESIMGLYQEVVGHEKNKNYLTLNKQCTPAGLYAVMADKHQGDYKQGIQNLQVQKVNIDNMKGSKKKMQKSKKKKQQQNTRQFHIRDS